MTMEFDADTSLHNIIASASEAIQNVSAAAVWIASSQELLAMTEHEEALSCR
jgi:hypothetical protein